MYIQDEEEDEEEEDDDDLDAPKIQFPVSRKKRLRLFFLTLSKWVVSAAARNYWGKKFLVRSCKDRKCELRLFERPEMSEPRKAYAGEEDYLGEPGSENKGKQPCPQWLA